MAKKLEGKVAVVTGGNSGIGEATGKALAQEGAKVALLARRQDKGQAVQDEIREAGGDATFISCDVSDNEAVEAAIAQAVETYGAIRILVNNAGGGGFGGKAGEPMRLEDNETWNRVIAVNLTGPFYVTRAVWPHMAAAGGGVITNISSGAAGAGFTQKMLEIRGGFDVSSYYAAKAGLEGFTRVTASMGCPGEYQGQRHPAAPDSGQERPPLARTRPRVHPDSGGQGGGGRHRQHRALPQLRRCSLHQRRDAGGRRRNGRQRVARHSRRRSSPGHRGAGRRHCNRKRHRV